MQPHTFINSQATYSLNKSVILCGGGDGGGDGDDDDKEKMMKDCDVWPQFWCM